MSHSHYLLISPATCLVSYVLQRFLKLSFITLAAQTFRLLKEVETAKHNAEFLLSTVFVAHFTQRTEKGWLLSALVDLFTAYEASIRTMFICSLNALLGDGKRSIINVFIIQS